MVTAARVCVAALALASLSAFLITQMVQAGGPSPAAPTAEEAGRKETELLNERAAQRLSKLADYLDQQATIAATDATAVRNAVSSQQSSEALARSLTGANSRTRSLIAKQAAQESFANPTAVADDPKMAGASVGAAIDEKASTYRDYAGHLKQLSATVAADPPDAAAAKLGETYVPADVEQILQPTPTSRSRSLAPASIPAPDANGSAPTPLQIYATGSSRVVGTGARASIDFPAVVALLQDQSSDPNPQFAPWCSGTLIAPNAVLTAAHCFCEYSQTQVYDNFADCKSKKFQLLNGSQRSTTDPSYRRLFFQHAGMREIERIEINDKFKFPFADLAIVILKESVPGVSPASFNASTSVTDGTLGTIAGFGRHSPLDQLGAPISDSAGPDVGLKFAARIMTSACSGGNANKSLICWSFSHPTLPQSLAGAGNTCDGDSGGPLFADMGGRTVLIGVTSGGILTSCGPGDNSFDVDVSRFEPWITQTLSAHQAPPPAAARAALLPIEQIEIRYHFAKPTWQFSAQSLPFSWPITLPSTVQWLRVSVNTDRVFQNPLRLQIVNSNGEPVLDANGKPICSVETEDSATSCEVPNQASSAWRVATSGPGSKWFQIVATGF